MSESIARLIDHALLHPTLTDDEIRRGCLLAQQLNVATVCVKPYAVSLAVDLLADSSVGVGTVIGFPHGSQATSIKAAEAELACQQGASEIDMVINIGKAIQGDWEYVRSDIQAVAMVGQRFGAVVKVIFETDWVTDRQTKVQLCRLCRELNVDYVKTSTGFGFVKQPSGDFNSQGAQPEDIQLMVEACDGGVQVKASGGIRSYDQAVSMQQLGATRLGTSASESIVLGEQGSQSRGGGEQSGSY